MNNNRKLWIDALRSGLYQQTVGHLNQGDNYCCLGVACEVYQQEVGDLTIVRSAIDGIRSYDGDPKLLPEKVRKWLGLTANDGAYEEGSLVSLNDSRGYSFEDIADLIETDPEGLFETA